MTQQEIQERNSDIALMLGYVNTTPTDKDFNIFENKEKPFSAIPKMIETRSMEFHSDWNWLMEVVEFIESKGFPFCVSWNEVTVTNLEAFLKQKETGECDILQPETIIHIYDAEDDKKILSKKEAVFIAISDFAKLYNNKEL